MTRRDLMEWAASVAVLAVPVGVSSLVYDRVGHREGFWAFVCCWALEVGLLLRLLWLSRPRELFK